MTEAKMGQVQLKIMQLLWKMKRATARELTDVLNKSAPIAHSTVQTLLRQLEVKGSVDHEQDGRTFYFFPLVQEEKVKKSAARELFKSPSYRCLSRTQSVYRWLAFAASWVAGLLAY